MFSSNNYYILLIYAPFFIAPIILGLVAKWRIYEKAGDKGWKVLIPFYGKYTLYKLMWDKNVYWFVLAFNILMGVSFAMARRPINPDTTIWLILTLVTYAVLFVFNIFLSLHLAKAFGHNGKFAVGLILVPVVFICILGFGKAQYIGIQPIRTNQSTDDQTDQIAAL